MNDEMTDSLAPSQPQITTTTSAASPPAKKRRGFAAMDPKKVSEIASKGGRAAHAAGTAHEFSTDEAREAGRKGGFAAHAKRKASKEQPG
jgi:general stress protein YciG